MRRRSRLARRWSLTGSVRRAVLVRELPRAVDEPALQVVVRIGDLVVWRAVPDLEVEHVGLRVVEQLMAVADARAEAGADAGGEPLRSLLGQEQRCALEDVDELVLFGVGVPEGRHAAWCDARQIDA